MLNNFFQKAFELDSAILTMPGYVLPKFYTLMKQGFWAVMPLFVMIILLALIAPLLIGGWVFSLSTLAPKFSRLNLFTGLKRMISVKGLVEMVKSLAKFILLSIVSIVVLKSELPELLALTDFPLAAALGSGMSIVAKAFLLITGSLILIAALDVPFQMFQHNKELKMTKQELRDEYKETEGKPEVKSQIRQRQHEMAKRRMMSEIPKANVVLTNPTHFAVAVSYQQEGKRAPIVVAKGKDLVALQINRVAAANEIPILSVPPLARALFYSTELNAEIPRGLYVAVAQVLAYIHHLRDKQDYDNKPELLQNVPIPDELRRDAEEIV